MVFVRLEGSMIKKLWKRWIQLDTAIRWIVFGVMVILFQIVSSIWLESMKVGKSQKNQSKKTKRELP